jgi:ubiquinone/menaquinone biosynthesis C-methylase UbiE
MTTSTDPFATSDRLTDAQAQAMVERLEARGRHPAFLGMLDEYLAAMAIDDADRVLDLGSGTGVVARHIARRSTFRGSVVGVDLSPMLIEAGGRLVADEGLAERVELRAGDTRQLEIPDASFDAVIAHTLLSHVPDPAAALREVARVTRPGGAIGIFDGDYASLTFGHPDPAKAPRYDERIVNAIVVSPRVMRDMPRLLRAAGLELVRHFGWVLTDVGQADFWASAIQMYRTLLPSIGAFTDEEANGWADVMEAESAAGTFFGAANFYAYVARRPA